MGCNRKHGPNDHMGCTALLSSKRLCARGLLKISLCASDILWVRDWMNSVCNYYTFIWKCEFSFICLMSEIFHHGQYGATCLTWLGTSCVATGSNDGVVRLWDSRAGECEEGTLIPFNLFLCLQIAITLSRLLWIIQLVFLTLQDFVKQSIFTQVIFRSYSFFRSLSFF
jgi:WD40 repeat protein